eukprot:7352158-Prymnesium_polylepis.1
MFDQNAASSRAALIPAHHNSATDCYHEQEKQRAPHCGDPKRNVTAIVAASIQLVKVLRIIVASTKLTSWPTVSERAVAISFVARMGIAVAGAPAPVRPTPPHLQSFRAVAPVCVVQVERCNRCICRAANAIESVATCALFCERVGAWLEVLFCADGASSRAARVECGAPRILPNLTAATAPTAVHLVTVVANTIAREENLAGAAARCLGRPAVVCGRKRQLSVVWVPSIDTKVACCC